MASVKNIFNGHMSLNTTKYPYKLCKGVPSIANWKVKERFFSLTRKKCNVFGSDGFQCYWQDKITLVMFSKRHSEGGVQLNIYTFQVMEIYCQQLRVEQFSMLVPSVKRCSVCRVWRSLGPAAQWPRCANHLRTPPGECFPPASHNTARRGPAATRHWRTTGMNTSKSWVEKAEKPGCTKGSYMIRFLKTEGLT